MNQLELTYEPVRRAWETALSFLVAIVSSMEIDLVSKDISRESLCFALLLLCFALLSLKPPKIQEPRSSSRKRIHTIWSRCEVQLLCGHLRLPDYWSSCCRGLCMGCYSHWDTRCCRCAFLSPTSDPLVRTSLRWTLRKSNGWPSDSNLKKW